MKHAPLKKTEFLDGRKARFEMECMCGALTRGKYENLTQLGIERHLRDNDVDPLDFGLDVHPRPMKQ